MLRKSGTGRSTSGRDGATLMLGALLCWCMPALADSIEAAPAPVTPLEAPLQKVGEARLRVMFWSIYDSRLYTPSGEYRSDERPLRLEIEYLRKVDADTLVQRTGVEWETMGRDHPRQEEWLAHLDRLWPDIAAGDVLSISIDEDNVSTFRLNGHPLGRIEDPDFGREFVGIWLSEESTRPELRQGLLGTSQDN